MSEVTSQADDDCAGLGLEGWTTHLHGTSKIVEIPSVGQIMARRSELPAIHVVQLLGARLIVVYRAVMVADEGGTAHYRLRAEIDRATKASAEVSAEMGPHSTGCIFPAPTPPAKALGVNAKDLLK